MSGNRFMVGERYYLIGMESIHNMEVPIVQTWVYCGIARPPCSLKECDIHQQFYMFKLHHGDIETDGTIGDGLYIPSLAQAEKTMLTWEDFLEELHFVKVELGGEGCNELDPLTRCSFCNRDYGHAARFVQGHDEVCICDTCSREALSDSEGAHSGTLDIGTCSFCEKEASIVGFLFQGVSDTLICVECIQLARRLFDKMDPLPPLSRRRTDAAGK